MLQIFYSNRYEVLSAALLADLAAQRADVWRAPQVIVPSMAIRRQLELDIAASQGICANIEFGYLAQWLWTQTGRVMPVADVSPFAQERLVWRCYRLLGETNGKNAPWLESKRLAAWLDAADDAMRYELAQRIAQLFDHYLTYRRAWLTRWQVADAPVFAAHANQTNHEDERWQSALWRALLDEMPGVAPQEERLPPVYRFLDIAHTLDPEAIARAAWPESVSVFALPTMPPLHIALLRELSRWIEVRLYVLNPCREFWFDIVSQARIEKLAASGKLDYQEVGHPLLARWGRQTQAQLWMLHELTENAASHETSAYLRNEASTWLARIQNAMLDLSDASGELNAEAASRNAPRSAGIEVHVCHSLTRQLEVLHDRLLAWFNADPSLQPADILVALPDLVTAAPLIDAVFGMDASASISNDVRRIPYRITGLPPSHTNPVAHTLLDWLTLSSRSVGAPELVEWLRVDALATRFDIDASSLETVQTWLAAAGARRGLTPVEPQNAQAPVARHTFADALTRLFLGYALPQGGDPIDAWLPIDGAEGSQAPLLGRLACFIDALGAFSQACDHPHTPDEWSALLHDMLEQCFDTGLAFADWLTDTREAIDRLVNAMREGANDTLIPAAVIRSALAGTLDDPARGGVPWGSVTFSSLTSLRGLPYRAICVLGMDDRVLPSPQRADEFDLMASSPPQPGDRQRRDDERNLFLDLLLAAREQLLIAYTGRNQRDNAVLPPAALVDELLDHLAQVSAGPQASPDEVAAARRAFIVEHPLQPFSIEYFSDNDSLFTYEPVRAELAQRLVAPQSASPQPFFAAPLPPESATTVMFDDFLRFWRHPARALLRDRLGIVLTDAQRELPDTEPFGLDYADRRALADRLLPILLNTSHDVRNDASLRERVQRIATASPELPDGATGAVWREYELDALYDLTRRIRDELAKDTTGVAQPAAWERLPFSLQITPRWPDINENAVALFGAHEATLRAEIEAQPLLLDGTLHQLAHAGQILFRYGSPTPGARDYLDAWLAHLVYCAAQPDGPRRTVWHGNGASFAFTPVNEPLAQLAPLVALYRAGRRLPLRFFPQNAWLFVTSGKKTAWETNEYRHGESDDPTLRIALRGTPLTLDEPFDALARCVFGPLCDHLQEQDAR